MILIVVAAATDSRTTYLIGSILGGIGFGIAFLGGLRALVAAIHELERADGELGLVTMCTAGGTGTGTLIQRI
jgi:Ca2+/Na+ antiporter